MMVERTIIARYEATCWRCKDTVQAGDRMRYGGPGKTSHAAGECPLAALERFAKK